MSKLKHFIRLIVPVATVVLLCVSTAPDAQANNGTNVSSAHKAETPATTTQNSKKPDATTQKQHPKSVFDADVLERPLSFFKDSYSSEDDDNEYASHTSTIFNAIKALIASLLSTIL